MPKFSSIFLPFLVNQTQKQQTQTQTQTLARIQTQIQSWPHPPPELADHQATTFLCSQPPTTCN